jgi:hypothetical protein
MGIKIGICGVGAFADNFIPLFKAHPEVVLVKRLQALGHTVTLQTLDPAA